MEQDAFEGSYAPTDAGSHIFVSEIVHQAPQKHIVDHYVYDRDCEG